MDEEFFELEKKASLIGASLRQVDIEAGGADIYWLIMPDGEKIVCTELSQVSYNLSHWQCDKKGNFVMKKNFDWIKDPERRKQAQEAHQLFVNNSTNEKAYFFARRYHELIDEISIEQATEEELSIE